MKFELHTNYNIVLKNQISESGIRLIKAEMNKVNLVNDADWSALNPSTRSAYLPPFPEDWMWSWVVDRGEYAGKFPTRLAKFLYKERGLKCPAAFLSTVGNIARAYSTEEIQYTVDFTNRIDWNAGEFGDEGSCLWDGRDGARVMIEENGYAIRFFDWREMGYARAWVAHIEQDELYILFNGYGFDGNATLTIAKIFAGFTGLDFKKIELKNGGSAYSELYINGSIGYIFGTRDQIADIENWDLLWPEVETVHCAICGDHITDDETHYTSEGSGPYCWNCYCDHYVKCEHCERDIWHEDADLIGENYVCPRCTDRYYLRCDTCGDHFPIGGQHTCETE